MGNEEQIEATPAIHNVQSLYRNLLMNLVLAYLKKKSIPFSSMVKHLEDIFQVTNITAASIYERRSLHTSTLKKIRSRFSVLTEDANIIEAFKTLYSGCELRKNIAEMYADYFKPTQELELKSDSAQGSTSHSARRYSMMTKHWPIFASVVEKYRKSELLTKTEIDFLDLLIEQKSLTAADCIHIKNNGEAICVPRIAKSISSKMNISIDDMRFYIVQLNSTSYPSPGMEEFGVKYRLLIRKEKEDDADYRAF